MENLNEELYTHQFIDNRQFTILESIKNGKLVSVYYELRLLLYLGIMLFTGGIGYLAYRNMGEMIHVISMILMGVGIIVGFFFIHKYAQPYNHDEVTVSLPYFDYLLLLVALLVTSLWVYIQVYFDLVAELLNLSSLFSAILFMYMAYRYDNRALLSMGITAIAATVGISITPVNWASGEWDTLPHLYLTSMLLGVLLVGTGIFTYKRGVKKHFRFTYLNFGILLYLIGGLWGMFETESINFSLFMLISSGVLTYYAWKEKMFLFFLYANLSAYIIITYLLFRLIESTNSEYFIMIYYFPVTCIGYIIYLIQKKSHFSHE